MKDNFRICRLKIDIGNTSLFVVLTEKVVHGIDNAKQRRDDSCTISGGERIHIIYCAKNLNSKTMKQVLRRKKMRLRHQKCYVRLFN